MLQTEKVAKATEIVMEERECANPNCSSTFKVMTQSPQNCCSTNCDFIITSDPKLKKMKANRLRYVGPMMLSDEGYKRKIAYDRQGKKPEAPAIDLGMPSPVPPHNNTVNAEQKKPDYHTLSGTQTSETTEVIPDEVHFCEKITENMSKKDITQQNQSDSESNVVGLSSETSRTVRKGPETAQKAQKLTAREDKKKCVIDTFRNKARRETKKKIAKMDVKSTSEEKRPLSPLEEREALWQRYVVKCKAIVHQMNRHRMDIATMALEACEINYGGGDHWKKHKDVFTLKKFAEEIGMTYKTLHRWVKVKRDIVDKLPEGYYDEDTDFAAATSAANEIKRDATEEDIKAAFDKWKERGTDEDRLAERTARRRSAPARTCPARAPDRRR